jgi:hypothetical protein
MMETVVQEEGRAKKERLKKKLTMTSPPEEWIIDLFPHK